MYEEEIKQLMDKVSITNDDDTLSFFISKLEQLKARCGNDTERFNKLSLRLRKQVKVMEEVIAIKKNVEREAKINNLLQESEKGC